MVQSALGGVKSAAASMMSRLFGGAGETDEKKEEKVGSTPLDPEAELKKAEEFKNQGNEHFKSK